MSCGVVFYGGFRRWRSLNGDPDEQQRTRNNTQIVEPNNPTPEKETKMAESNAVTIKLPAFYKSNPAMWFRQVEAQFAIRNPAITDDNTKYAYLLSVLPADIAELMEFAVENATAGNRYNSLKDALIKQFGLTKAQKAKKLASFTTLDPSMTPTTLLMQMRPLSSDSTSEEFFHKFKSVMPPGVRTALAGRKFDTIEAYAEAADDVAETIQECSSVYTVSQPPKKEKKPDKTGWCFYHTRFGSKARKCRPPCKFATTENDSAGRQ